MTNPIMDSSEEEALFRSYPYAALYFVQSPTTTVSHGHQDAVSFHSPATQRRLTLSHYSSSRGSTNSFLHDKKINPYAPHESPDHHDSSSVGRVVVKMGEKGCDFVDNENVHRGGGGGGDGAESEEEEEEEEKGFGKRMWDLVSFSESDSCAWIWFQISLRVMVSFGVALLFFYLITKPPPPIVSLKVERMSEFQLAEGVDNTGVTTKFLTCNCSINLHVNIKSNLYGLHIHPMVLTLSFNNIPLATSLETRALYASTNGPTSFLLYLGTTNKPMYGAGRSMQDILDSGKGLSLVVHVKLRSRFHVVGKLISPKYHHRAECILIFNRTYNKQHKTLMYDNHCNLL
ncbi:uncharacterized protein LOC112519877 [Cynara cardunculus var. scolymus]|uniref:Late embryogenesis abundant protein, LEA-14 n=1 Tax=Cynara cardunculus var. scolymus TaxID=59895 RepID=A0A124SEN8_CYNCS|nr:uncharacterized protein LOC112519877 [Cynara cardunculus var. scolymus]KVI00703.1 hypothetical protein Ccrd_021045 [Cynara cardunculus var. scolymus]